MSLNSNSVFKNLRRHSPNFASWSQDARQSIECLAPDTEVVPSLFACPIRQPWSSSRFPSSWKRNAHQLKQPTGESASHRKGTAPLGSATRSSKGIPQSQLHRERRQRARSRCRQHCEFRSREARQSAPVQIRLVFSSSQAVAALFLCPPHFLADSKRPARLDTTAG